MKKKDFITLLVTTIGLLTFGVGMSMALLPEWNMFKEGVIFGSIGFIILIAMFLVRRKWDGKSFKMNLKTLGIILYGLFACLVFGIGLSMAILKSEKMFIGIIIGIAGIGLLMGLIPLVKGFKD